MTPANKQATYIIQPLIWPLSVVQAPFSVALLAGGIMATLFAYLISFPVFRVRGDYLAIVTLGLGEVVRVLCNAWQGVTNGSLDPDLRRLDVFLAGPAPFADTVSALRGQRRFPPEQLMVTVV